MEYEIQTINELPDKLLLKILSCLPSKDVVATSVLSKRWQSLWEEVETFRYDGQLTDRSYWRFVRFISKRSSLKSLQLKLKPHFDHSSIKTLVNIAVTRCLRELRIEMVYNFLEFPKSIYISSQLETLILEKLSLADVPPNVFLISLKRLHLLSVKFSGDQSVKTLLSICTCLEELVIRRSSYTNVRIFTIDVPTLRSLSIDNSSGNSRPKGVHGFVINAPSLRTFNIRDTFSNYLRFANMPNLVNSSVDVTCNQPDKFIRCLASTQYLSLCCAVSQLQTPYPRTGNSFLFLDHLELCLCSVEWWDLLTFILYAAPRLQVLNLKPFNKHCVKKAVMDLWDQPNSVPECLSYHLEILEWRQYNGTKKETEAAKYILANASRLKKATFYSESAEKHGMLNELQCVARSSKTCNLVFE